MEIDLLVKQTQRKWWGREEQHREEFRRSIKQTTSGVATRLLHTRGGTSDPGCVFQKHRFQGASCLDGTRAPRKSQKRHSGWAADFVGALTLLAPGAQRLLADPNDRARQIGARLNACAAAATAHPPSAITLAVRTPDRAVWPNKKLRPKMQDKFITDN